LRPNFSRNDVRSSCKTIYYKSFLHSVAVRILLLFSTEIYLTVTNQTSSFAQAIDYETPQKFVTAWEAAIFPNLRHFNSTFLSTGHAFNAKNVTHASKKSNVISMKPKAILVIKTTSHRRPYTNPMRISSNHLMFFSSALYPLLFIFKLFRK
jgi:hypothetical protein